MFRDFSDEAKQKQNTINSKLTRARKKLKEIMEVEYE